MTQLTSMQKVFANHSMALNLLAAGVFKDGFESGRSWTWAQVPWNSVLSKPTRDMHVARLFYPLVAVVNSVIAFSRSPKQALIIVLILLQGITILDYLAEAYIKSWWSAFRGGSIILEFMFWTLTTKNSGHFTQPNSERDFRPLWSKVTFFVFPKGHTNYYVAKILWCQRLTALMLGCAHAVARYNRVASATNQQAFDTMSPSVSVLFFVANWKFLFFGF